MQGMTHRATPDRGFSSAGMMLSSAFSASMIFEIIGRERFSYQTLRQRIIIIIILSFNCVLN